jgi:hypothetical protein
MRGLFAVLLISVLLTPFVQAQDAAGKACR